MALCAIGMNARTEKFTVSELPTNNQETTIQATSSVKLTYGNDTGWKVNGSAISTDGISGTGNPKKDNSTAYSESNKTLPNTGVYYIFEPSKAGELDIVITINEKKSFYVVDGESGEYLKDIFTITDSQGNIKTLETNGTTVYSLAAKLTGGHCTMQVKANKKYYVFCTGSKLGFTGFEFTPAPEITATISDFGYSTFASSEALDFTDIEGLTAYTATVNGSYLVLTPATKVSAGTGLVLKGKANATYTIPTATVEGTTESALTGVTEEDYELTTTGVINYVLDNVEGTPGFYKYTGTTIPAGKAYLQLPETSEAKNLTMVFGDATAISEVKAQADKADGAYYNLSGQRVAAPVKGLYIRGGKKVIVK